MSKEEAIIKMGEQAAQKIQDNQLVGLGSGSAVAAFVNALGKRIEEEKIEVHGIPTSMQVEIIAQNNGIILESQACLLISKMSKKKPLEAAFFKSCVINANSCRTKLSGTSIS